MALNNFETFKNTLDGDREAFVVHGRLIDDKFALSPDIKTIVMTLVTAMDDVLNKLRSVPRWLRNTNVRCPFIQDTDTGDIRLPCSFYDHVVNRKHVSDAEKECYDSMAVVINRLKSTVKKYNIVFLILHNSVTLFRFGHGRQKF